MSTFQILCVTMFQKDFSKIKTMNVHSNIIFANQCNKNSDEIKDYGNYHARMISTVTRGVGINRNFLLQYADADICLLSDDDIIYDDDVEEKVIKEFKTYPEADIIFFHLNSSDESRSIKKPKKTIRLKKWARFPWGGAHIAFRLDSIKKANVWFSTLFGGGCIFPSGEDSIWLLEARKKGLVFYASKETIGKVDMSNSSWYTGVDKQYYYGKGAMYECVKKKPMFLWELYFALRTKRKTSLSFFNQIKWMEKGRKGFKNMKSYSDCIEEEKYDK